MNKNTETRKAGERTRIYHGYSVKKHDRGYTVTTPRGATWCEIAPTFKVATKWIECDQAEKFNWQRNAIFTKGATR